MQRRLDPLSGCAALQYSPQGATAIIRLVLDLSENPTFQRRRLSRRGPGGASAGDQAARRRHHRGSRPQPQRREQFAHARCAGARRRATIPMLLRQRHADRLRASGDLGTVRFRARHRGLGRQRRGESRRRHVVLGNRGGRRRGAVSRVCRRSPYRCASSPAARGISPSAARVAASLVRRLAVDAPARYR